MKLRSLNFAPNFIYLFLGLIFILHIVCIYSSSFMFDGNRYFYLVDDAMIGMRYARNLVDFGQIQYNPFSLDTPQGYTAPLWILIMSFFHLLKISDQYTSLLVSLLGSFLHISFIYLIYFSGKEFFKSGEINKLNTLFAGLFFPVFYWSNRGMELSLQIFILYSLIFLIIRIQSKLIFRDLIKIFFLVLISIFTRFDSLIIVLISLAFLTINYIQNNNENKKWVKVIFIVCIPIISVLALLLIQKWLHGDYLPNTYHLKVGGFNVFERASHGLKALVMYAKVPLILTATSFLYVGLFCRNRINIKRNHIFLISIFLGQLAYSIYAGGDYADSHLPSMSRFFAIGYPAIFLFLNNYWGELTLLSKRKLFLRNKKYILNTSIIKAFKYLMWIAFAIIFNLTPLKALYYSKQLPFGNEDKLRAILGLNIDKKIYSRCRLAGHGVGNTAYFAKSHYINDLLGKSDKYIANKVPNIEFSPGHSKWDYEYSINKQKTDIVFDVRLNLNTFQNWDRKNNNSFKKYPLFLKSKNEGQYYIYARDSSCFRIQHKN